MKKQQPDEGIKLKGMFRIHLTEDGKVVGDSGWTRNTITGNGFNQYLCLALAGNTGSKSVSHIALANGTAAISSTFTSSSMTGEFAKRTTVTAASSSTSKTVRFTGSFSSNAASTANFQNSSANTLASVGLWNSSSGGTMFAGNTFSSSTIGTNQSVTFTYDIIFN